MNSKWSMGQGGEGDVSSRAREPAEIMSLFLKSEGVRKGEGTGEGGTSIPAPSDSSMVAPERAGKFPPP